MNSFDGDPYPDTFDSRDVDDRIAELKSGGLVDLPQGWFSGDKEELARLIEFRDNEQPSDRDRWGDGITYIKDDYFGKYAEEYASDIHGDMDGWPFEHINWEAATDSLRMDYEAVDFGGYTYLTRG